jgi:hypothetical protein
VFKIIMTNKYKLISWNCISLTVVYRDVHSRNIMWVVPVCCCQKHNTRCLPKLSTSERGKMRCWDVGSLKMGMKLRPAGIRVGQENTSKDVPSYVLKTEEEWDFSAILFTSYYSDSVSSTDVGVEKTWSYSMSWRITHCAVCEVTQMFTRVTTFFP